MKYLTNYLQVIKSVSRKSIKFKTIVLLAYLLVLTACGGGTVSSSGGESGMGGTGIFVKGNVSEVDGQMAINISSEKSLLFIALDRLIPNAHAQVVSLSGITVSGGGRMTVTDSNGGFVLENVEPSDNFILLFVFENGREVSLNIGSVSAESTVTVSNVSIDTNSQQAQFESIEVESSGQTTDVETASNNTSGSQRVDSSISDAAESDSGSGSGSSGAVTNDDNMSPL